MSQQALARYAPLAIRLIFGPIFLLHGMMKFMHLASAAQFFGQIGIPLPQIAVPVIAALEVIGGVGLMLGVGTQLLAFLLACDMLVAVVLVSVKQGFGGGSEFELALLAGLVALVLGGAGPFTVLRPRKEVSRPQKEPIVPGAFATPRK